MFISVHFSWYLLFFSHEPPIVPLEKSLHRRHYPRNSFTVKTTPDFRFLSNRSFSSSPLTSPFPSRYPFPGFTSTWIKWPLWFRLTYLFVSLCLTPSYAVFHAYPVGWRPCPPEPLLRSKVTFIFPLETSTPHRHGPTTDIFESDQRPSVTGTHHPGLDYGLWSILQ